jgi:putative endonuclease
MYSVYVLKSLKDNRTYVGFTKHLDQRLKEHNSGQVESTKNRTPFILWYKEDFSDQNEAYKKEKFYKTSWGRRKLKNILSKIFM